MASNKTPNLNLPQYSGTDLFNLEEINESYKKIDDSYKEINDNYNKAIQESTISGSIDNLELVDARGGHTKLKYRLDSIDSSLEQIEQKKVNKEVARLKETPIGINDFDNTVIQAIQGNTDVTVLSIPRGNSVSPSKTTFFNNSTNLVDKNKVTLNKTLSSSDGTLVDNSTANVTDFIDMVAGQKFVGSAIGKVCFYKDYVFLSAFSPTNMTDIITCPQNTTQIRVAYYKVHEADFRINLGETLLDYEPYWAEVKKEVLPKIEVGTKNILDDSVTTEKASFFKKSKNLYNKNTVMLNTGIDSTNGSLTVNNSAVTSEEIYVIPGEKIAINGVYVRRAFYTSNDVLISTFVNVETEIFTVPSNTSYMRISIPNAQYTSIMVNRGEELLPYEDYYDTILNPLYLPKVEISTNDILDNSVTVDKTDFFKKSKNLYDKNTVLINTGINSTDGTLTSNETAVTSQKINVIANEKLTINGSYIRRAFYTSDDVFISTFVNTTTESFTVPPSASYMRISIPIAQYTTIMLNRGEVLLPYEDYYDTILNPIYLPKKSEEPTPNENKPYVFSTKEIKIDYTPINVKAIDGTSGTDFNADTITTQNIYDKYDELVSKYPKYISKTLLGKDATNTFNIYRYDFKPEKVVTANGSKYKDIPTVILTGGIHGNGENAGDKPNMVCALYYFFKDVCEKWKENEVLDYLRWNLNFIVVPIVNPWGFDNKDRRNGRQVDLNRNFDLNWTLGTPGSNTYGGTAPFSEKESQYIRDLINANKNAIFHCDFHTTGGTQAQDKMMYFDMSNNSILFNPARDLILRLSKKWNDKKYGGLDTSIDLHGYIVDEPPAPIFNSWVDRVAKIPSCTLEGFPNYVGSLLQKNSLELMTMACEEVGNWVLTNTKFIYDYYK